MLPDTDGSNPKIHAGSTPLPSTTEHLFTTEPYLICHPSNEPCTSRVQPSPVTGSNLWPKHLAHSPVDTAESTPKTETNEQTGNHSYEQDNTKEKEEKEVAHHRNMGRIPVDQQRFILELVANGEDEESIVLLFEVEFACTMSEGSRGLMRDCIELFKLEG